MPAARSEHKAGHVFFLIPFRKAGVGQRRVCWHARGCAKVGITSRLASALTPGLHHHDPLKETCVGNTDIHLNGPEDHAKDMNMISSLSRRPGINNEEARAATPYA